MKFLGVLSKVTVLSVVLVGLHTAPVIASNSTSVQFQSTKSNQFDQQQSFQNRVQPRSNIAPSPVRNIRVASKGGFGVQVSWSKPQRSGNAPVECYDQFTQKTTVVPVCYSVIANGNWSGECGSTTKTSCFLSNVVPVGNTIIEVRARNGNGLESSASVSHWHFVIPFSPTASSTLVTPGPRSLKIDLHPDIVPSLYDINSEFSQGALISALEVLAYPAGTTIEESYTLPKVPKPLGKCTMSRSGKNSFAKGCTISKLTNGASYDLLFRARNAAGWSPVSSYVMSFSHIPTPVAPTPARNVKVTPIKDGLRVTWSRPASDGGAEPMDLTDYGGPKSVKVAYEVTVNGVWAHNCLSWKTSCVITGDLIRPGEVQYIAVYSYNNTVGSADPWVEQGMAFSTPAYNDNNFLGIREVENGRQRISWYNASNVWNDRGAEITTIEVVAFRWDESFAVSGKPKPVVKCSVTKSGKKPLAESCLLPTLPKGIFYYTLRAKNKAGWSEYVLKHWNWFEN